MIFKRKLKRSSVDLYADLMFERLNAIKEEQSENGEDSDKEAILLLKNQIIGLSDEGVIKASVSQIEDMHDQILRELQNKQEQPRCIPYIGMNGTQVAQLAYFLLVSLILSGFVFSGSVDTNTIKAGTALIAVASASKFIWLFEKMSYIDSTCTVCVGIASLVILFGT